VLFLLLALSAALVGLGFAAGRYASWFGLALPMAITVALGFGWEWDRDAVALLLGVALSSGLGVVGGVLRRRRQPAEAGLGQPP
jgi:hypothetical protein